MADLASPLKGQVPSTSGERGERRLKVAQRGRIVRHTAGNRKVLVALLFRCWLVSRQQVAVRHYDTVKL
jgi:hypothetical protein